MDTEIRLIHAHNSFQLIIRYGLNLSYLVFELLPGVAERVGILIQICAN